MRIREHAVIIEDDYDAEFRFGGRPLDALQTLDRTESVFYVGTFSKSLFPALRLGFAVAPPWAQQALGAASRDMRTFHSSPLAQETLAAFITEGHLARHVRRMRQSVRRPARGVVEWAADGVRCVARGGAFCGGAAFNGTNEEAYGYRCNLRQHWESFEVGSSRSIGSGSGRSGDAIELVFGYGALQTSAGYVAGLARLRRVFKERV